jgi:hypothetical protein
MDEILNAPAATAAAKKGKEFPKVVGVNEASREALKKVNIHVDELAAPVMKQYSWGHMAGSAKFFFVVFVVLLVIEMILEAVIYFKNKDRFTTEMMWGYWIRYVIAAVIAIIAGLVMFIVINTLAHAGWWKLAWLLVFMPFIAYLGAFFSYKFWSSLWSVLTGKVAVETGRSMWTPMI